MYSPEVLVSVVFFDGKACGTWDTYADVHELCSFSVKDTSRKTASVAICAPSSITCSCWVFNFPMVSHCCRTCMLVCSCFPPQLLFDLFCYWRLALWGITVTTGEECGTRANIVVWGDMSMEIIFLRIIVVNVLSQPNSECVPDMFVNVFVNVFLTCS